MCIRDRVCFYLGNKLLVKRYIAGPGQWVNIEEEGNVAVYKRQVRGSCSGIPGRFWKNRAMKSVCWIC